MNYRVTKYNPAYRNEKGWYMKDDWTDYSEVVKTGRFIYSLFTNRFTKCSG